LPQLWLASQWDGDVYQEWGPDEELRFASL